jgi:hypothetical protein
MWLQAVLLTPYIAIGSSLLLIATVAIVCASQTARPAMAAGFGHP